MKTPIYLFCISVILLLFQSCGIFLTPPANMDLKSNVGEPTATGLDFRNLPKPKEEVIVGVYKFRDQTGQYKASEMGSNWSTAVPQGLTTILIKSLEDSKWFIPIERENIGNLLNERQIIRTTRQEYSQNNQVTPLPPLLFAGIILEGGVISYDTNVLTGGAGARYFGIGGSTQYRQDRITVYLRAVSTNSGKILKTVYTSKTILSHAINASMFRYVDFERLMEAEVGITNNEPVHMAVTEAINKAVYMLILEGIQSKLWETESSEMAVADSLMKQYEQEIKLIDKQVVGKGEWEKGRRSTLSAGLAMTFNTMKGDFASSTMRPGGIGNVKYQFADYFNTYLAFGYQELGSKENYRSTYSTYEANLEYLVLPYNNFTPFFHGGAGLITDSNGPDNDPKFKVQFGGGLEYLASPSIGVRAFGTYHMGFDDDWDQFVSGKRDDHFLQVGLGLQFYFGKRQIK